MDLPQPDPQKLLLRDELVRQLSRALPLDQVIHRAEDLIVYECDALSAYRQQPMAVVLPSSTAEVAIAVRTCAGLEIPIIPWGAGTGLSRTTHEVCCKEQGGGDQGDPPFGYRGVGRLGLRARTLHLGDRAHRCFEISR